MTQVAFSGVATDCSSPGLAKAVVFPPVEAAGSAVEADG